MTLSLKNLLLLGCFLVLSASSVRADEMIISVNPMTLTEHAPLANWGGRSIHFISKDTQGDAVIACGLQNSFSITVGVGVPLTVEGNVAICENQVVSLAQQIRDGKVSKIRITFVKSDTRDQIAIGSIEGIN